MELAAAGALPVLADGRVLLVLQLRRPAARMSKRPARLRLITWNVWVGNHPRNIRCALIVMAALFRPHVIALQEARRFTGTIPGYRRLSGDGSKRPDADQQVILVRKRPGRQKRTTHTQVDVPGPGWTYEGNPKPPRTFHGVRVPVGGLFWNVLNVHRCVGGPDGKSRDAWHREDAAIVEWAESVPKGEPTVLVGDWNDVGTSRRPGAVADLADRIDARILTAGRIDYALVRGCGGVIRELRRSFKSDHAPRLLTLRAHRKEKKR